MVIVKINTLEDKIKARGPPNFKLLKNARIKRAIADVKCKKGTRSAINATEGFLLLQRGEFKKNNSRIRKFVKGLKKQKGRCPTTRGRKRR